MPRQAPSRIVSSSASSSALSDMTSEDGYDKESCFKGDKTINERVHTMSFNPY